MQKALMWTYCLDVVMQSRELKRDGWTTATSDESALPRRVLGFALQNRWNLERISLSVFGTKHGVV